MDGYLTRGRVYNVRSIGACDGVKTLKIQNNVGFEGEYFASRFREVPATRQPHGNRGFWLVKGVGSASHEHSSVVAADAEAERLARLNPGQVFTVLGPIRAYCSENMSVTDLSEELERGTSAVPF